jgi:hypothetical protein
MIVMADMAANLAFPAGRRMGWIPFDWAGKTPQRGGPGGFTSRFSGKIGILRGANRDVWLL